MFQMNVDLGDRSYPIHVGPCLSSPGLLIKTIKNKEVVIVTNEIIAPLYLSNIEKPLIQAGKKVSSVILKDGEKFKTLDTVTEIFNVLLSENYSRKVVLVALGGGVIGDMTGFAAATYQRGVDFIQVPTTLLSQVDSSVGGKTGVNHPLGKNMMGAFKQPLAVFIDPSVLSTLPKKELSAGFAEVIKHGIIQDESYFNYLEENLDSIFSLDPEAIREVIIGSCRIKSNVVNQDETEQGIRAILNLGHTFGHAIETTIGYGRWLHGEAVAVGMLMAADLSQRMGLIGLKDVTRISELIKRSNLPIEVPKEMTVDLFLSAMYRDKKVDAGQLKIILFSKIGGGFISSDFELDKLNETLTEFCGV